MALDIRKERRDSLFLDDISHSATIPLDSTFAFAIMQASFEDLGIWNENEAWDSSRNVIIITNEVMILPLYCVYNGCQDMNL